MQQLQESQKTLVIIILLLIGGFLFWKYILKKQDNYKCERNKSSVTFKDTPGNCIPCTSGTDPTCIYTSSDACNENCKGIESFKCTYTGDYQTECVSCGYQSTDPECIYKSIDDCKKVCALKYRCGPSGCTFCSQSDLTRFPGKCIYNNQTDCSQAGICRKYDVYKCGHLNYGAVSCTSCNYNDSDPACKYLSMNECQNASDCKPIVEQRFKCPLAS